MNEDTRTIVVFLLFGLVAGWLASFVVGGSMACGLPRVRRRRRLRRWLSCFKVLGIDLGIKNRLLTEMVTAVIGAIIVVVLRAHRILGRRRGREFRKEITGGNQRVLQLDKVWAESHIESHLAGRRQRT